LLGDTKLSVENPIVGGRKAPAILLTTIGEGHGSSCFVVGRAASGGVVPLLDQACLPPERFGPDAEASQAWYALPLVTPGN
jgi:hypothetical protein